MKKKGFTLVELLVVIAIIALLMGILMPALAKVRAIAYRTVCGTNLSGIGKAMLVYANDYDGGLPAMGGNGCTWLTGGTLGGASFQSKAENTTATTTGAFGTVGSGTATITASLYYLVRAYDVAPAQFVCKGDTGTKPMNISNYTSGGGTSLSLSDVWDFGFARGTVGSYPGACCSYAYQMPYSFKDSSGSTVSYSLNTSGDASTPVCADRNPYQDKNSKGIIVLGTLPNGETYPQLNGDGTSTSYSYSDPFKLGNSMAHQQDGQNIMYMDSHVTFSKTANMGISNDNIYKSWGGSGWTPSTSSQTVDEVTKEVGVNGTNSGATMLQGTMNGQAGDIGAASHPSSSQDSLLVNELFDGQKINF